MAVEKYYKDSNGEYIKVIQESENLTQTEEAKLRNQLQGKKPSIRKQTSDLRTNAGRKIYKDPKTGENYSEKSTTFQTEDGKWITMPTVNTEGGQFDVSFLEDFVRRNGAKDPLTGRDIPLFESEEEAVNYAKERMYKNGLNEKINIKMEDYRDVESKYNSIASIEMIEAVGQNYLKSYFQSIKKNLNHNGKAAIQAITIDDNLYERYRKKEDFIQKYIFPGGFLPCKKSLHKHANETGLEINVYNSYGLHYSNTLKIWRDEFYKKWSEISQQGFDLTFKRMWNFYLSYCEAGFKSKNIDLIQFSLQNK